jgi:hypothetical protein
LVAFTTIFALSVDPKLVGPAEVVAVLFHPEVAPYFVWSAAFLATLVLQRSARRSIADPQPLIAHTIPGPMLRCLVLIFGLLLGFAVSAYWGNPARSLPPLYHDEYSYLFQAKTFLAGRLFFPEPPMSEAFQQVHILCGHGIYASRYFPGTGAWLAPFVAFDLIPFSGYVAHALVAGFMGWAACRTSFLAGLFTAVSVSFAPGLVVFSHTLLSTYPTMIGLAIGWLAFTQTFDEISPRRRNGWAVLTGLAIGFAFLCRPLTAAAIATPWGMLALRQSFLATDRRWLWAMIIGFSPAVLLLAGHNTTLTGSPFVTPYGQYTERHTPSHVYGFFNRTRGEMGIHPEIDISYDRWATELDLHAAWTTSLGRVATAVPWIGGHFVFVAMLILSLRSLFLRGDIVLLPLLSIFGLIAAYFPYFYSGVMEWSYLVEAVPFLIFVGSIGLADVVGALFAQGQRIAGSIVSILPIIAAGITTWLILPQALHPDSELLYPRLQWAKRHVEESRMAADQPTLILYDIDRIADQHSTWVFNDPDLAGPIIRGWSVHPEQAHRYFPDRKIVLYRNHQYRPLTRPDPPSFVP